MITASISVELKNGRGFTHLVFLGNNGAAVLLYLSIAHL
jgi:hypothetical protein